MVPIGRQRTTTTFSNIRSYCTFRDTKIEAKTGPEDTKGQGLRVDAFQAKRIWGEGPQADGQAGPRCLSSCTCEWALCPNALPSMFCKLQLMRLAARSNQLIMLQYQSSGWVLTQASLQNGDKDAEAQHQFAKYAGWIK